MDREEPHVGCGLPPSLDRRAFVATLAAGALAFLEACSGSSPAHRAAAAQPGRLVRPLSATTTTSPPPALPPIPGAHPGKPKVISQGPTSGKEIALTIDDGTCAECVAGYVDFAVRSGIPITFSPNGIYEQNWSGHVEALRPLLERGQVQFGNHTWSHPRLVGLSDARVTSEIERNEEWIERTFGVTSRPWFRPPYGLHNRRTDGLAAEVGFTDIVLWNGTFGDAKQLAPDYLMANASRYLVPGTIMLGHANHDTVLGLFDRIQQLLAERELRPVTLDTMFATTRQRG